jgi:hypothetical protein
MANKYKAKKVITNYGKFDSEGEYKYYLKLLALKNAVNEDEKVIEVERQIIYPFIINGMMIGKYIADYVVTYGSGKKEVIDFKNPYIITGKGKSSPIAQLFKYKCKMMKALYDIDVKIV